MAVRTLSLCFRSGRFRAGCFRFSKAGLCFRLLFRCQLCSRGRAVSKVPGNGSFFLLAAVRFFSFGFSGRRFSRFRSDRCSGRLISLLPPLQSVVWHALCNSIVNCGSATAVRFLHLFKFGLVVLGGQPPEAAGNREIPCCFCLVRSQARRTFFQQVVKTFIRDSRSAPSGCNIPPPTLRFAPAAASCRASQKKNRARLSSDAVCCAQDKTRTCTN